MKTAILTEDEWAHFAAKALNIKKGISVTCTMRPEMVIQLDQLADTLGASRSDVIRIAVAAAIVGLTQDVIDKAKAHIAMRLAQGVLSVRKSWVEAEEAEDPVDTDPGG